MKFLSMKCLPKKVSSVEVPFDSVEVSFDEVSFDEVSFDEVCLPKNIVEVSFLTSSCFR